MASKRNRKFGSSAASLESVFCARRFARSRITVLQYPVAAHAMIAALDQSGSLGHTDSTVKNVANDATITGRTSFASRSLFSDTSEISIHHAEGCRRRDLFNSTLIRLLQHTYRRVSVYACDMSSCFSREGVRTE